MSEKDESADNSVNVKALKAFFQSQNQPIMGLRSVSSCDQQVIDCTPHQRVDHRLDRRAEQSESGVESGCRAMPRPPSSLDSGDMSVSALIQVLPTAIQSDGRTYGTRLAALSATPLLTSRPIPKPRKSLQLNASPLECDASQRSHSLTTTQINNLNELSFGKRGTKSRSMHSLMKSNESVDKSMGTHNTFGDSDAKNANQSETKQTSNVLKRPFRSFNMRSKLMSLRKKSTEKLQKFRHDTQKGKLPVKPTRSPPIPPLLKFRPAAPLPPNEDYYEDIGYGMKFSDQQSYELYNDAGEEIYSRLDDSDEESVQSEGYYEGINDYDDGLANNAQNSDHYYEDSLNANYNDIDRIYEVLPFENDEQSDNSSISLVSLVSLEEKSASTKEFDRKKDIKLRKLKKKFHMTGDEKPINDGTVKQDYKGNSDDLTVRKGEVVRIIRMESNPPGKWLACNSDEKVGYVDLSNIVFDAQSVKCIIQTLIPNKP